MEHNCATRVLVTGGSGFVGTTLVQDFLENGSQVLSIDVVRPQNPAHEQVFRQCDILDRAALEASFDAFLPTSVIHLAAQADLFASRSEEFRVNTDGTQNLVDCIKRYTCVQRSVFASTRLVVPPKYTQQHVEDYCADTLYGQSKAVMERIVRTGGLVSQWCIIRPTSIWGPWRGTGYTEFFLRVARGVYFHPGRIDPPKSYGFVGNTSFQIRKLLAAARGDIHGHTFYLADYESLTIRRWADAFAAEFGRKPIRTMPCWVMRLLAAAGDLLWNLGWKNVPMTSFRLRNMWTDMTIGVSVDEIQRITGPLPYSLAEGVRRTAQWLRQQGLYSARMCLPPQSNRETS